MSKSSSFRVAAHRLGLNSVEFYALVARGEIPVERKMNEPPRVAERDLTWFERCRDERVEHEKRGPVMAIGTVTSQKNCCVVGFGIVQL